MLKQNPPNAYGYSARTDQAAELTRLRRQAGLDLGAEQAMWKRAGLRNGMRILDLGCGPGVVTGFLAEEFPESSVTGLDVDETLLARAREHANAAGLKNVKFHAGSAYATGRAAASVDFVYARFLFQHLADPAAALAEIRRVLRPGGLACVLEIDDRFLVVEPQPYGYEAMHRATGRAQARDGGCREIGGRLAGLLREAGFARAETLVHTLRSADCGMENFVDVALRFKLARLARHPDLYSRAELAAAARSLDDLAASDTAWGALGLFTAIGERPVGG